MSVSVEGCLLGIVFGAFAFLFLAEMRRPYRLIAKPSLRRSVATNASAFLFNNIVASALSVASLLLVAQNYSHYGILSGFRDGPGKWAACFVLFDFAVYLWHVLGHKSEQLWRLHKVHHSDKNIHVTTGLRFHIFDQLLEVVVKCLCTIVIGVEAHVVVVCELVRMAFVLFHHANVVVPGERWLSYLIITPSLHRTHHSTRRSEHDSNYGIVLAVWDILFGTRKELVPRQLGLEMIEARNLLQLFSLAFVTEQRFARALHFLPGQGASGSRALYENLAEGCEPIVTRPPHGDGR